MVMPIACDGVFGERQHRSVVNKRQEGFLA